MPASLDALEGVVRREYDAQERRADALDTKAGLVLGFSGLLASLTPETLPPWCALVARAFAGTAALMALAVFAANMRRDVDLAGLRRQSVPDMRWTLVMLVVTAHGEILDVTRKKLWRVRAALLLAAGSLVTIGTGTTVAVVLEMAR